MTDKQCAARFQAEVLIEQSPISKASVQEYAEDTDVDLDAVFQAIEIEQAYHASPVVRVHRGIIEPVLDDWTKAPALALCLIFDVLGAAGDPEGTRLFERVVEVALRNHLQHAVYDNSAVSGRGLRARVRDFATLTSLMEGRSPDPDLKDDRVDLIAHTSFDDERSANLYVLMQCAAGKRWTNKKQIELDRWAQYLDWPRTNISRAISTVQFLEPTGKWQTLSTDYGMLMDRVRIHRAYGEGEEALNGELEAWVKKRYREVE